MMAPQNTVIVYPQKVLDEVGFSFKNVIIDSLNPKIIYIATNNGVYKSPDRGDTWQLINQGLLDTAVRKILASPSLILAEGENGIYKLSEKKPKEKLRNSRTIYKIIRSSKLC